MTRNLQELLPFYVNGSLSAQERRHLESALKSDPDLQAELDFLKGLRAEVKAQPQENAPGELGLKRLQKSLAAEKIKNDPVTRARSKITREQTGWWKAAAIAACVMLLLQTAVTYPLWQKSGELTAADGPHAVRENALIVSATFSPDATERKIRALLLSADVRITGGPSALGVYRLAIPEENAEEALEMLRARDDLIESLDAQGRP